MTVLLLASLLVPSRCPHCGVAASAYGCDCRSFRQWNATAHPRAANGRFGTGSGTTAQSNVMVTGPVTDEHKAALDAAIDQLPDDLKNGLPPVNLIKIGDESRERWLRATTSPNGWVDPGGSVINVPVYSQMYIDAMRGDRGQLTKLSSLLVHEAWHINHGTDEAGAYAAQLDALHRMRAPKSVVREIERDRDYAVKQPKNGR